LQETKPIARTMPANYLKITARRLLRQKTISLINIFGLSIGLAACLLIYLYVRHELSYDTYHPNAARVARLTTIIHNSGSDVDIALAPFPAAASLLSSFPDVEAVARVDEESDLVIRSGTEIFGPKNFMYSEPAVFSVFGFTFLEGTAAGALSAPYSVVLSRSAEKKYFGAEFALGKTLECNRKPYKVTGVFADQPANTDLKIDGLLSKDFKEDSWLADDFAYTYVLFRHKPDLAQFNQRLSRLTAIAQPNLDENAGKGWRLDFHAEALTDVHFARGHQGDSPKGDLQFDRVFSALAIFILLIALLNYINLATARAAERAKEVGVRKVIGATPGSLVRHFLTESAILVSIAWLVAIGLVALALPFFDRLLDTQLSWKGWATVLLPVLLFPLTVGLAGGYPALVLSRFRPVSVLKGRLTGPAGGASLRKILTVAQFVIALAMLAGVVVFISQMQFIQHRDLGLDQQQILHISMPDDSTAAEAAPAFYQALRQESGIRGVSVGSGLPVQGVAMNGFEVDSEGKKKQVLCHSFFIDAEFLPLLHISLAEGRNYSDSLATDRTDNYIVNQAFVRSMGWKSGLGRKITTDNRKDMIIGVVTDFFWSSLHNPIEPALLIYKTDPPNAVLVKAPPSELPRLKQLWKTYFPYSPFDYWFMDEAFNAQYKSDRTSQFLFNAFTSLAIIISCLGLYGLVSLITIQRTKEIGIRKVLGAPLHRLVMLLSADQLWLIGWAALIALPLAALGAQKWLASYAYHTSLNLWVFVLPVLLLLLLTLAVTGYRILRAALANPVDSLRAE
jgi:putative ABC transport system permease protein